MHADPKDVMVTIVGASVAIAGLLLVFSGFLFAQAASFPSNTSDALIEKFRRGAQLGMIPFVGALADAGMAFGWMLNPSPNACLYQFAVGGFIVLLVLTGVYGLISVLLL